jgi:hypothetical protein
MTSKAGLSVANRTNHSARKTAVETLLHAGVAPTDVMQLTGHKNVQSLNSYAHLSTDQQHSISNLLSNKSTQHPAAATAIDPYETLIASYTSATNPTLANFTLDFDLDDDTINQLLDDTAFDEDNSAVGSMSSIPTPSAVNLHINDHLPQSTTASFTGTTTTCSTSRNVQLNVRHNAIPAGVATLNYPPPAPLHPSAQRYHFLNGAITGNVTVHFHEHFTGTPSKRRRMNNSDNTEE